MDTAVALAAECKELVEWVVRGYGSQGILTQVQQLRSRLDEDGNRSKPGAILDMLPKDKIAKMCPSQCAVELAMLVVGGDELLPEAVKFLCEEECSGKRERLRHMTMEGRIDELKTIARLGREQELKHAKLFHPFLAERAGKQAKTVGRWLEAASEIEISCGQPSVVVEQYFPDGTSRCGQLKAFDKEYEVIGFPNEGMTPNCVEIRCVDNCLEWHVGGNVQMLKQAVGTLETQQMAIGESMQMTFLSREWIKQY